MHSAKIEQLTVAFKTHKKPLIAVDGLDFSLKAGETLALLGESGCGKSLTALALMRLLPERAVYSLQSRVWVDGEDLLDLPEFLMRSIRGHRVSIIFQEPMTALNPVLQIGEQLAEALLQHQHLDRHSLHERMLTLLHEVELPDPELKLHQYPHQLSGGQKQRVVIAMALANKPEILIADEPTTALDVTIQAQILALLKNLQKNYQMSLLLITHDLGVVKAMADRVCLMYAGQLIEQSSVQDFFAKELHPYAQQLVASRPSFVKRGQRLDAIPGTVPGLDKMPKGCRFHPRCAKAFALCSQEEPQLQLVENRLIRCHLYPEALQVEQSKFSRSRAEGKVEGIRDVNRLLAEPALGQKELGVTEHRTGVYTPVHGSSCTESTQRFSPAVGLCKKSNESKPLQRDSSVLQVTSSHSRTEEKIDEEILLEVRDLSVDFNVKSHLLIPTETMKAVDGLSFALKKGQTVALVGESGCGKTTTSRAILRLVPISGGEILYRGQAVHHQNRRDEINYRKNVQVVFQDPYSSLNPRMSVDDLIAEGMVAQGYSKTMIQKKLKTLVDQVGLPGNALSRYAHQFSGGQRQRICIARALAIEPEVIICDEPTSALDISVQAQILNLLRELQYEFGVSYLFITHNMAVVSYIADEVIVMHEGRCVEKGSCEQVLYHPTVDYTKRLLASVLI